jgi:CMD domain protein
MSQPSSTEAAAPDVIDALAGIAPDSPLRALRAGRAEVLNHAQASYRELLEPSDPAGVSLVERALVALRVASLGGSEALAAQQRKRLQQLGAGPELVAAAQVSAESMAPSGRLGAILAHVDLLSLRPGDATRADIEALSAEGLSPRDIVTLSQLIAFLHFEVRVLAGLRALGGS